MVKAKSGYPASLLAEWLDANLLDSHHNTRSEAALPASDIYPHVAAAHGSDAADDLRRSVLAMRRGDFAAGIKPVAQGMLDLAHSNGGKCVDFARRSRAP